MARNMVQFQKGLIPTCTNQHSCAHLRIPMDLMRAAADQLVPSITAMIDDLIVGFEDVVGEPIIPHELPDVFYGIEF